MLSKSEQKFHRKIAVAGFNRAWDYLVKKKRTSEDDRVMLNLAHSSAYHWKLVGTPKNRAVSDWQISRVYAALQEPQLSLKFAKACLELCQKYRVLEIMSTANEAMARAYAVGRKYALAKKYLFRAQSVLNNLKLDPEDREIFAGQIKETEKLIGKRRR
jgi:hypothetical protein